jgi:predicted PurR-regulated permease PerM
MVRQKLIIASLVVAGAARRPVCREREEPLCMQSESPPGEHLSRPRWDGTIKVVVGVILFVLFAVAVYVFRIMFTPLIIGIVMAYILHPLVRLIQRNTRLSRGLATGLLYLLLLALAFPVGAILLPTAIRQIVSLQREAVGFARYLNTVSAETAITLLGVEFQVQELVRQITSALTDFITSVATSSVSLLFDAAKIIALVVFTFVIGFYLTKDAEYIMNWLHGLVPPAYRSDARWLVSEIDIVWSNFLRGQVLLALIVTAILTVVSAVLGLPQPLLLGIWGGLLEFLPSIGHAIWGFTVVVVALVSGSNYLPLPNLIFALVVFGAYVAFTQLDINILIPSIIGRHMRLHPVVIILGVIIGASMGGVLGVALAAPAIASLRIVLRYLYANLFDLEPFPATDAPAPTPWLRERRAKRERLAVSSPSNPSPEPD